MSGRTQVLLLVHPGSCCGSADFNLGRGEARSARELLISELDDWQGPAIVMDGDLSSDLGHYPAIDKAIRNLLARDPRSLRFFGCDNVGEHFTRLLPGVIAGSVFSDREKFGFSVTGAWYDPDNRSGCVNASIRELRKRRIDCELLDSAFHLSLEEAFEDG